MTDAKYMIQVRFRKIHHQIELPNGDPTCEELAAAISSVTAADQETIKLSMPGKTGTLIPLQARGADRAGQIGLKTGSSVVMYASTAAEVQHVRDSKDLPGMAGFQQELKQHMRRQRGSQASVLPSGAYTFQGYEAWQQPQLSPQPLEALKLLHRLAADPGIVGIMKKHRWSVGLLSEMPPEGKVGVSPVCILGVNINAGQEISLRLRTDDLKGFRRYDRIRETLCHELAHMVWGEHDNRFKQLNSQLLKECGQLDWTGHAGHALQAFEDASAATWVDEDDVMAVTAQTSGQTLRQLTGNQQAAFVKDAASPRRAAAMAASARLIASVTPSRSASPDAALSDSSEVAPAPLPVSGAAEEGVQSEAQMSLDPSADIANLGHRDASTEQAEEAMRQLGSMDFTSEVQQMHSPDTQQHATSVMPPNPLAQSQVEPAQQNDTPQAAQHITGVHNPDAAQQSASTQVADTQGPVLSDAVNAAVTDDPATQYNQASQLPQQPALLPEPAETVSVVNSDATLEQQGPETDAADEQSVSDPAPMDVDVDDPALQRYRKAEAAVAHLKSEAGVANQLAALQTLLKILQNIVSHPGEPKYSQIRLGNPAFHSRAGQFAAARELLAVAGFTEEAAGAVDGVLVWKRHDQGLLWLTLSAVENAIQQVS